MAKRKRGKSESLEERDEDVTKPDAGESESLAALDQTEAEVLGEANPPPVELTEEIPKEEPKPLDDGLPKVDIRVFSASGSRKWDQLAGFRSYAKRLKLGPLSIPEWREALAKFMNRPVS